MVFLLLSESRGEIVFLLFPQWVSVPDKTILFATLQTAKAQLWQIVIYVWTLSLQPGLIQWGLSVPKGSLFFFFFFLQWCKWVMVVSQQPLKKSVTLTHLFVYACLSTCRPPVLSQVLPRAHSASQGSVVAVHRMQDLQQLSGSRKECGEWMSEYGGLAA